MIKRCLALYCSMLLLAMPVAQANLQVANKYIPQAKLTGQGRLSFLFWDVYDARLYASQGQWEPNRPFALSISYLMALNGEDIAERGIKEMEKQGFTNSQKLEQWYQVMTDIFPNVDDKTTLTAIRDARGRSLFYHNGEFIDKVDDREFTEQFFKIWLGENTSEPELRKQLLNLD